MKKSTQEIARRTRGRGTLTGGLGNDNLKGGTGNDALFGGEGDDDLKNNPLLHEAANDARYEGERKVA